MTVLNTILILSLIAFLLYERWKEKRKLKKQSQKMLDFYKSEWIDEDGNRHFTFTP